MGNSIGCQLGLLNAPGSYSCIQMFRDGLLLWPNRHVVSKNADVCQRFSLASEITADNIVSRMGLICYGYRSSGTSYSRAGLG